MSTGFWISRANAAGTARLSGSEVLLSPAPTGVIYPDEPLGSRIETPDGRLVVQQPAQDARVRSWVWKGYPGYMQPYVALWNILEGTRSSLRKAQGGTPYVYLRDDVTGRFYRHYIYNGVVVSADSSSITVAGTPWTGLDFTGYISEVMTGTGIGQVRAIVSISNNNKINITPNWSVNPVATDTFTVRGRVDDWFRVRVVGVTRKVAEGGGYVRYEETRLEFCVEDVAWNQLG
jgi:hypothetical protein